MNTAILRWGILGTAEIARKNWKAIRNTGNGTVTAVASRRLERARQFISDCQAHAPMPTVPEALEDYESLLTSSEVDAVYIPLPTGLRKPWVIRAAQAGKHVLCEKPCAAKAADAQEMVEACRRNGVQFADGVMFMHSRRLEQLRQVLRDGRSVGSVKRICSAFSFPGTPEFLTGNIRLHSDLEPLGCLGDLGWYCIRFALWVMEGALPQRVIGHLLSQQGRPDSPAAVPTDFSGELFFPEEVSASFSCSFLTGLQQWAMVAGTQGYLQVSDLFLPFFGHHLTFETHNAIYNIQGCDFNMEDHPRRHSVNEYSNSHPTAQETNLFREFGHQVQTGRFNEDWAQIILKTQTVIDACLESAGKDGQSVLLVDPAASSSQDLGERPPDAMSSEHAESRQ